MANLLEHARRILVVRLDNIGDVVMLSPALRALKEALPQAQLTLMVSPAGSQVAPLLPWVDEVMVWRSVWQDASGTMPLDPARELALVDDLRSRAFDAAVIFTSFSQSPYPPAYVCYLAGIPIRLGQSKEFGGSVLTLWVKAGADSMHQVDRSLVLLEAAGVPLAGRELELHVPQEVRVEVDALLQDNGLDRQAPFIVLAPGASCAARRYDPARYAEVARGLAAETGWPILVVGSEHERELAQPILQAGPRILSLIGRTSIPQLAEVIRRARLVICNDSGPMHLADAFRRPMVILYSGTEYETQWQPRSAPHKLLRVPTRCSPCFLFRCSYNMECLDIPPATVVASALELLERRPTRSLTSQVGALTSDSHPPSLRRSP